MSPRFQRGCRHQGRFQSGLQLALANLLFQETQDNRYGSLALSSEMPVFSETRLINSSIVFLMLSGENSRFCYSLQNSGNPAHPARVKPRGETSTSSDFGSGRFTAQFSQRLCLWIDDIPKVSFASRDLLHRQHGSHQTLFNPAVPCRFGESPILPIGFTPLNVTRWTRRTQRSPANVIRPDSILMCTAGNAWPLMECSLYTAGSL